MIKLIINNMENYFKFYLRSLKAYQKFIHIFQIKIKYLCMYVLNVFFLIYSKYFSNDSKL